MLNLSLNEDQRLLKDELRKLLEAESSPEKVRAAEPTGFDKALWRMLVEFGLVTMRVDEAAGGGGAGLMDAALVAEELGRHLASAPVIEAIVAARILAEAGAASWLEKIANGAIVTIALHELDAAHEQVVPAGAIADAVLALDGDSLVVLSDLKAPAPPANLAAAPLAISTLRGKEFSGSRHVLASGAGARRIFLAGLEEWKLLTAAAVAAAAGKSLEMAAVYSCERTAFDNMIGTFQGLSHPLADCATEVDGARLLVWRAVWAIAKARDDAAASVSMASWWTWQAAERAVRQALRTFGGYGLCLEYDVQLYYRRARAWALMAGAPRDDLLRVADRLWDETDVPLPDADAVEIDFGYGEKADAFAAELRRFVEENITPELRARFDHSTSSHDPAFHKKLAAAGYAFPDLPAEYGGQNRSTYEVLAASPIWEEIGWNNTAAAVAEFVAKIVLQWGTPEAKQEVLSKIASGEAVGCLGFSEPASGSDIFAATLKAVRDGDNWIVNGQKMFTTGAHIADYILLLARTASGGPKHKGITVFVAPLKVPGVEIQRVDTLQAERTNIVYFHDVRVPDRYRLGEVDRGMAVMQSALDIEHGGTNYYTTQLAMLNHAVSWARTARGDDTRPIDDIAIREGLAKMAVHCAVGDVLCRRADWAEETGQSNIAFGPMAKLFVTESMASDAADFVALAAPASLLQGKGDLGMIELTARRALGMTIYGGTSEIQRSLIAEHFLHMPRSRG